MPPVRSPRWRKIPRAAAGLALVAAVAFAGCDLQEDADLERGRELFIAKCGTCHTLAEAATTAEIGPNLDSAFQAARANGNDADTIEGVVQSQIENPRPASPDQTNLYMPPELVTGQDAENVAAYVASVAGIPGIKPPTAPGGPGGQVFAQNGCGSCHTLEAAGATGTVGPNLDQELPGQSAKEIEESITDPNAKIVSGFPPDTMPQTYGTTIVPDDLKLLVDFLMTCSGDPQNKECQ
jgi:mono/diheme cytochrome c family protein